MTDLLFLSTSLVYGFINDTVGTHGSRTIMLKELRLLFAACPRPTSYADFRAAIVDENVLLKSTATTRHESFRRLRELYGLDEAIPLFRGLRDLWDADTSAQPLLAILCALARDALLRGTASVILATPPGEEVTPQMLERAVQQHFPDRYGPTTLANVGRHAASSWQQAGHLQGRARKVRRAVELSPGAVTYALWLGYLCGARGDALFTTAWARLLDASAHNLHAQAALASKQGLLEYRHTGAVTEITFRHLMRAPFPTEGAT
ncbi:MAG TPA: hypothetical protein GYA08_06970 [Chloroflexi bacterium]|nr:hypothetical protein [Chloroflexota bacterium]